MRILIGILAALLLVPGVVEARGSEVSAIRSHQGRSRHHKRHHHRRPRHKKHRKHRSHREL